MSERKVNLKEIFFTEVNRYRENYPNDKIYTNEEMKNSPEFPYFISSMKEACRQTLKLAAEKIKSDALEDFGTETPDCWNSYSIIDTINQVE